MKNLMKKLRNKKGQGAVEYALVTLVIVLALVAIIGLTDNPIQGMIEDVFSSVQTKVSSEVDSAGTS